MDFELDEDDQLLRDNVREFSRKELAVHASAWDEAEALPDTLRTSLGELGLLGLQVPEPDGGAGLSMVAAAALLEELAVADAAVAAAVAVHNVLGLGALLRARAAGVNTSRDDLVAAAAGAHWLAWCGQSNRLKVTPAAAGLVLGGACDFIVGAAPEARVGALIVLATGEDGKVGVFRVAGDAFQTERLRTLGLRATAIGTATFAGVPAERLGGADDAEALVARARVAFSAISVGVSGAALLAGRDYALERQQFGRPIAQFQAIQWKIADTATELEAGRLLTLRAAVAIDAGEASAAAAAARAKAFTGGAAVRAASQSLQIHGGYGYTREFPVERYLRNARTLDALVGGGQASRVEAASAIAARFAP